MKNLLTVRKLMMFLFQEIPEKILESKGKANSPGVLFCLYLVIDDIFASPPPCLKLYGYHIINILSTKGFSPDQNTNCDNIIREQKMVGKSSLIYPEFQPEIKL